MPRNDCNAKLSQGLFILGGGNPKQTHTRRLGWQATVETSGWIKQMKLLLAGKAGVTCNCCLRRNSLVPAHATRASIDINFRDNVLVNLTNVWRAWQKDEPDADETWCKGGTRLVGGADLWHIALAYVKYSLLSTREQSPPYPQWTDTAIMLVIIIIQ